jgi:hypothetical protein
MFATRSVLPKAYKPSSRNPDKFYWKSVPAGPCTPVLRHRNKPAETAVFTSLRHLRIASRTWNFLRPWAGCGWVGRPWTGRDSTSERGFASPCQLIRLSASDMDRTAEANRQGETIPEHRLDRLCRARRRE